MVPQAMLAENCYAFFLGHPEIKIQQATSRQFAGQLISLANPNLRKKTDLIFSHPDDLKNVTSICMLYRTVNQ